MQAIVTDPYYLRRYPSLKVLKGTVKSVSGEETDTKLYRLDFAGRVFAFFEDEIEILKQR